MNQERMLDLAPPVKTLRVRTSAQAIEEKWGTFPERRDAGDNTVLEVAQRRFLVEYARHYGLDAWQGHVCMMYGKPFVTYKGALSNARQYPEYAGYTLRPLASEDMEARGLDPHGWAWECAVQFKMTAEMEPVREVGYVSATEVSDLKEKLGPAKAAHLPVVKDPGLQALRRALRRAHTVAFALKATVGEAFAIEEGA